MRAGRSRGRSEARAKRRARAWSGRVSPAGTTELGRERPPRAKKRKSVALPEIRSAYSAPQRFTAPIVASSIAEASALKRGAGPEGTKPLITRWERRRLVEHFEEGVEPRIVRLLERATSATARGLILRAIHARIDRLASSLSEVESFARGLRLDEGELLLRATVLDLDSTTNSVAFDPLVLSSRRGVIRAPLEHTSAADNDGLFQRLTASCGPTVVQMMVCNADPISSFEAHRGGLHSDGSNDPIADFQRRLLEAAGGIALGRRESLLRARMRNGAGRLHALGLIERRELHDFRRFTEKQGERTAGAERVLSVMQERYGGPTRREIDRLLRAGPLPEKDEGIGPEELLDAIHRHVTPLTGVSYEVTNVFARGQCWRYLDRVEKVLREGIDVPFGVSEPGHWMLMTHAKGRVPNRSFLVSDPEGGRTAWVKERDLRDGSFVDRQFHLCIDDQRGYVDCFLLPIDDRRA
jgi:hypothetical protein